MRIHRLELRHFRGIVERVVELPTSGVTVILGDNETGKSSLLEALDLLFRLPDDSKATRLRAVQPVGRDVGTDVAVELTLGPWRLWYRKRWFRQRATELTVRPDPEFAATSTATKPPRSYTGREAHDEASRLFGEHVDQMLWASLAVTQETSTTLPVPGSVGAVLSALDGMARSDGEKPSGSDRDEADDSVHEAALDEAALARDGDSGLPLAESVEREYLRYFTKTGKPTGQHQEALTRYQHATEELEQAQARWAEVEHDIHRAERLSHDQQTLTRRLTEQNDQVAVYEARRREVAALTARAEQLVSEHELVTERLATARRAQQARQQAVDDLATRAAAITEAAEVADQHRGELRQAESDLAVVRDELRAAREEQRRHRDRVAWLEEHAARLRDQQELTELQRRCAAIEQAHGDERAALARLDANPVDEDALESVEATHREVLVARATLTAGSATMTVQPLGSTPVDVDQALSVTGSDTGSDTSDQAVRPDTSQRVDRGTTAEITVDRPTVVRVDGVVEMAVQPGDPTATLAAEVDRAEHVETERLRALGASDIADARQAARDRRAAEQELALARDQLTHLLAGSTIADLRDQRDTLAARVAADTAAAEHTAEHTAEDEAGSPENTDQPTSIDATSRALANAREAESVASGTLAELSEREAQARKAVDAASEAATAVRVRAEQEAERHTDAAAALAAAREAESDERLEQALTDAEEAVGTTAGQCAQARTELVDSGADRVEQEYTDAVAVADQLSASAEQLVDELGHVQGRLEMAGAHGLASQLEQARTEYELAEQTRDVANRRAAAAARLRSTLERHRAQARRRYASPLRTSIVALGQALHGSSAFDVTLGDELEVAAREVDGVSVPVGSLSTGAREQLAVLVRLAIASLTATDGGGVPVILDDALGWSDPGRLRSMGALLAKAGASSQVIILTCLPDRYVYIPGASIVRL